MKNKCEMNLYMAEKLSQDRDTPQGWTTSVHCSYYAVFQYMKYLLAEKATPPISYEAQNSHQGESSHEFIIEKIKSKIADRSIDSARKIRDRIRNLKHHRVEADYLQKVFTNEEALDCKQEADGIMTNLRTYFNV